MLLNDRGSFNFAEKSSTANIAKLKPPRIFALLQYVLCVPMRVVKGISFGAVDLTLVAVTVKGASSGCKFESHCAIKGSNHGKNGPVLVLDENL